MLLKSQSQKWATGTHAHTELNFTLAPYCVLLVGLIDTPAPCSGSFQLNPEYCSEHCHLDSSLTHQLWPVPSPRSLIGVLSTWTHKVITNLIFQYSCYQNPYCQPLPTRSSIRTRTVKSALFTASLDSEFWAVSCPSQGHSQSLVMSFSLCLISLPSSPNLCH